MAQTFFDMPVKKNALQSNPSNLTITDQYIRWGDKELRCMDVDKIKYGITIAKTYGVKTATTYQVVVQDRYDKYIRVILNQSFLTGKNSEQTYTEVVEALWNAVTKRIVEGYIDTLNNGKNVTYDKYLEITPQGLKVRYWSWFKRKDGFIDWSKVHTSYVNGQFIIRNSEKKSMNLTYSLQNEWNTVCLSSLMAFLLKDGRARALAQGSKL